jgi:hypothetical protein
VVGASARGTQKHAAAPLRSAASAADAAAQSRERERLIARGAESERILFLSQKKDIDPHA